MQQHNETLNGVRYTAWLDEQNAALGVVANNTLHLLYTQAFGKKRFSAANYQKVIKKAKAKFGVGQVVEHSGRAIVAIDGQLHEYRVENGKAVGVGDLILKAEDV